MLGAGTADKAHRVGDARERGRFFLGKDYRPAGQNAGRQNLRHPRATNTTAPCDFVAFLPRKGTGQASVHWQPSGFPVS
jgi:hypothetical protein